MGCGGDAIDTIEALDHRSTAERSQACRYVAIVELRVLGPLEAHGDQGRVELRPVERRLLAALVACRPAAAGYEALAEAVWPDRVPRSAKHSLQTHVMRIRRTLGRDCVVTADDGYRLGPSLCVDVDDFESMGRLAHGAGEPADEARRMGQCLVVVARRAVRRD